MRHNPSPSQRRHRGGTSRALALITADDFPHQDRSAAAIDAELAVLPQPAFDNSTIEALLDAYLDERGRLVPARMVEAVEIATLGDANQAKAVARARQIDELRASAWADGTLRSYGAGVRAWKTWCRDEGVAALPFDPVLVAEHLMDFAFSWTGDQLLRDQQGRPIAAVTAGTVTSRLSSLNKAAEFLGLPRPGDNQGLAEVMRGIRRSLGSDHARRRAALDLSGLERCVAAASGTTFQNARDRAAVLLRARVSPTAGELAAMRWPDIAFADGCVEIELPSRTAGKRIVTVPAHRNPRLCLVRALSELRQLAPDLGSVLCRPSGDAMTRQALHMMVTKGGAVAGGWKVLPVATDRQLSAALGDQALATPLFATRDVALVLTGFYTARRRSELEALRWKDMTDHDADGWEVRIRRSKTDQEAKGVTKWVPQAEPGAAVTCPASALRRYRASLTAALGREPHDTEPVFASLSSLGRARQDTRGQLQGLTGDGINDVVRRLAVAAGLATSAGGANPYGGHSLRSGFVTEALRDDKLSVAEVQDVTDHRSVDILMTYRREVNAAKRNGGRKLLQSLMPSD